MPSVEQIVRAAIYKELKGLDYRELEYHQSDSRICEQFVKNRPVTPVPFSGLSEVHIKNQSGEFGQIAGCTQPDSHIGRLGRLAKFPPGQHGG
jgi:ribulose 1,5-bisphosphate carboxylase large subunit-like protein